jgi:hypothetical protein
MSMKKLELMMAQFCKTRKKEMGDPRALLKDSIISGKCHKMDAKKQPIKEINGLPETFSESQSEAVVMALQEPLSIIWGPPGCGKTLVVSAIVANWIL